MEQLTGTVQNKILKVCVPHVCFAFCRWVGGWLGGLVRREEHVGIAEVAGAICTPSGCVDCVASPTHPPTHTPSATHTLLTLLSSPLHHYIYPPHPSTLEGVHGAQHVHLPAPPLIHATPELFPSSPPFFVGVHGAQHVHLPAPPLHARGGRCDGLHRRPHAALPPHLHLRIPHAGRSMHPCTLF